MAAVVPASGGGGAASRSKPGKAPSAAGDEKYSAVKIVSCLRWNKVDSDDQSGTGPAFTMIEEAGPAVVAMKDPKTGNCAIHIAAQVRRIGFERDTPPYVVCVLGGHRCAVQTEEGTETRERGWLERKGRELRALRLCP